MRKREIAIYEKIATDREIEAATKREEREREKELLATHVTHGARDNFARIASSCQRAASLPSGKETRFRFFRPMRLSRRISYGRTVEEKFLRTYSKLCFTRNHDAKRHKICKIIDCRHTSSSAQGCQTIEYFEQFESCDQTFKHTNCANLLSDCKPYLVYTALRNVEGCAKRNLLPARRNLGLYSQRQSLRSLIGSRISRWALRNEKPWWLARELMGHLLPAYPTFLSFLHFADLK